MYLSSLSPQGHKLQGLWYVPLSRLYDLSVPGKQALNVIFIFIFPERMNNNWMRWSFLPPLHRWEKERNSLWAAVNLDLNLGLTTSSTNSSHYLTLSLDNIPGKQ